MNNEKETKENKENKENKEPVATTNPVAKQPVPTTNPVVKQPVPTANPVVKQPVITGKENKIPAQKPENKLLNQKRNPEKPAAGDDDDEPKEVFILDNRKRVAVERYRGEKKVDIREYYEHRGEFRPCKRGISLSESNWIKLKEVMNDIDEALKKLD